MSDWSLLGAFTAGAGVCFLLLKGAAVIKNLWPSRAKPRLLEAQNCSISGNGQTVWFELLVDNTGSRDCAIISVELQWPNGRFAKATPNRKPNAAQLSDSTASLWRASLLRLRPPPRQTPRRELVEAWPKPGKVFF